jgi:long-chain acyl-CoA synthetase
VTLNASSATPESAQVDVAALILQSLHKPAQERAIEFDGQWHTWGELRQYGERLCALLDQAGVPPDAPIGLVVRNRLAHAAVILGLVAARCTVAMVHAFQSPEAIARDLAKLRAVAVVADAEDWTPAVITECRRIGTMGIVVTTAEPRVAVQRELQHPGAGPFAEHPASAGLQLLSSGTTGTPKRIHLPMRALARGIVTVSSIGAADDGNAAPAILYWPLGNVSVMSLIAQSCLGRRMVLLERFRLDEFLAALRKHRPSVVAMPPPVIRQILLAGVPKEAFASLELVSGGSGPLEPETQEKFEAIYGIPIIWRYGATEFAGTLASWSAPLRKQFPSGKRGSVGRALEGTRVRIVDMQSGAELPHGQQGFLEGQVALLGPEWIRTTDIGSMDDDGFIYIHGRGDSAIIRGGFKIIPERVVECLREHPGVADAAVIGIADAVLGQVPVAVVEQRAGGPVPSAEELEQLVRSRFPAHHVPTRFMVVERLPRTASLKVSIAEVRKLAES